MNASGDASFTYLRTVGFGSNEKSDTVVYVPPPPKESSSPPDQKTQAIARERIHFSHILLPNLNLESHVLQKLIPITTNKYPALPLEMTIWDKSFHLMNRRHCSHKNYG